MPLFILVFASVLGSGAHYVWVWRKKAFEENPANGKDRSG